MCLGMLNVMLCPHLGWQGLASCSSHPLHLSGSLVHPLSLLEGTGVRTSVFSAQHRQACSAVPQGHVWEGGDTRVTSGGLPEAWVTALTMETLLRAPHLQQLAATGAVWLRVSIRGMGTALNTSGDPFG